METKPVRYAVSRNRAVWKCHDALDAARSQLEGLAGSVELAQLVEGFDASGRSAVVSVPVEWRVELLHGADRVADVLAVCRMCRGVFDPSAGSCGCFDNGCE